MDAVLLLFSFTDRTSFDDLSNQIAKWTGTSVGRVAKVVVGTKYPFVVFCKNLHVDFINQFESRAFSLKTQHTLRK